MARRSLDRWALWQLTRTRVVSFLREPEAVFWVFAFPILLALALGIAFRNQGPQPSAVGVEAGPDAEAVAHTLGAAPDLTVSILTPKEAATALRHGRIAVLVRPGKDAPSIEFDATRPETRLARLMVVDELQRAAGRHDPIQVAERKAARPGSRYIDFLIPGLIGLNLLGTGMWGIGFPIANARQLKLLKRMIATPMRRSDYLVSLMAARLVWLVLEVGAIVGFGALVFGVTVRGSWLGFVVVSLVGALAFSALGLLVACRARTIEAVSGLMNFVMMPMWLLSGSFFSAERFPQWMQPLVQVLPLTTTNNVLRALMNEGVGFGAVVPSLLLLGAWGLVSFFVA